jgi:Homing endonuclease
MVSCTYYKLAEPHVIESVPYSTDKEKDEIMSRMERDTAIVCDQRGACVDVTADRVTSTIMGLYSYVPPVLEYDICESLPIDPYFMGLWLGDGHSRRVAITSMDAEIADFMSSFCMKNDLLLKVTEMGTTVRPNKAKMYSGSKRKGARNTVWDILKSLGVAKNKHIPDIYKKASTSDRAQVIAGLMDSDGYMGKGKRQYHIAQKRERLHNDIVELFASLGFHVKSKTIQKGCTNAPGGTKIGTYFMVTASPSCRSMPIPVLLARKRLVGPPSSLVMSSSPQHKKIKWTAEMATELNGLVQTYKAQHPMEKVDWIAVRSASVTFADFSINALSTQYTKGIGRVDTTADVAPVPVQFDTDVKWKSKVIGFKADRDETFLQNQKTARNYWLKGETRYGCAWSEIREEYWNATFGDMGLLQPIIEPTWRAHVDELFCHLQGGAPLLTESRLWTFLHSCKTMRRHHAPVRWTHEREEYWIQIFGDTKLLDQSNQWLQLKQLAT